MLSWLLSWLTRALALALPLALELAPAWIRSGPLSRALTGMSLLEAD